MSAEKMFKAERILDQIYLAIFIIVCTGAALSGKWGLLVLSAAGIIQTVECMTLRRILHETGRGVGE